MTDLLPDSAQLSVFLSATLVLGLTPGPDMILVINRSLGLGFKAGMITLFGIMVGGMMHMTAAAFGLSLVLINLPHAYDILRFLGAAYLLWMAIGIARHGNGLDLNHADQATPRPTSRLLRQAFLTNILNPKVILFLLAFLPQFVPAQADNPTQRILVLGAFFFGIGFVIMALLAALADRVRHWVMAHPTVLRGQSYVTSVLLFGFAAALAFSNRP
ncbi:threonine transporter RhtB [Iodidimonas gelatinilytica]|uniref:Threonine transporter RhtB n=1 Tax=Iodidimonas gelatinilytica TaxID=1236966 RepID=A0A5A7MT56_9PROT|nr:LysE family translocator [Iodidimonas gelatinilytica]GEQ98986.1 threonine transporter RhtB [Iodidimonas gelatinilytica]